MSQLFFKLSQALKEQDSAMDRDISIEDIEISTNEDGYQEVYSKVKGKRLELMELINVLFGTS